MPPKKFSKSTAKSVASSYKRGSSIRDIARRTGKSYGTVHNMLTATGTKKRSRGGPNHHGKKH